MAYVENLQELAKSISFEVEPISLDKNNKISSNNRVPLNVKVKVRKKIDGNVAKNAVVAVPKMGRAAQETIRLVSSDQTIMSFKVFMEDVNQDKIKQKVKKSFFRFLKPAGRNLDSETEDIEENSIEVNSEPHVNNLTRKEYKGILGKCKPGGCLDPPFGEDRYAYKITNTVRLTSSEKTKVAYQRGPVTPLKKDKIMLKDNNSELLSSTDSILKIFPGSKNKSDNFNKSLSNSMTYPPAQPSSELLKFTDGTEMYAQNKNPFEKRLSSFQGSTEIYFPPKESKVHKRSKSQGISKNDSISNSIPLQTNRGRNSLNKSTNNVPDQSENTEKNKFVSTKKNSQEIQKPNEKLFLETVGQKFIAIDKLNKDTEKNRKQLKNNEIHANVDYIGKTSAESTLIGDEYSKQIGDNALSIKPVDEQMCTGHYTNNNQLSSRATKFESYVSKIPAEYKIPIRNLSDSKLLKEEISNEITDKRPMSSKRENSLLTNTEKTLEPTPQRLLHGDLNNNKSLQNNFINVEKVNYADINRVPVIEKGIKPGDNSTIKTINPQNLFKHEKPEESLDKSVIIESRNNSLHSSEPTFNYEEFNRVSNLGVNKDIKSDNLGKKYMTEKNVYSEKEKAKLAYTYEHSNTTTSYEELKLKLSNPEYDSKQLYIKDQFNHNIKQTSKTDKTPLPERTKSILNSDNFSNVKISSLNLQRNENDTSALGFENLASEPRQMQTNKDLHDKKLLKEKPIVERDKVNTEDYLTGQRNSINLMKDKFATDISYKTDSDKISYKPIYSEKHKLSSEAKLYDKDVKLNIEKHLTSSIKTPQSTETQYFDTKSYEKRDETKNDVLWHSSSEIQSEIKQESGFLYDNSATNTETKRDYNKFNDVNQSQLTNKPQLNPLEIKEQIKPTIGLTVNNGSTRESVKAFDSFNKTDESRINRLSDLQKDIDKVINENRVRLSRISSFLKRGSKQQESIQKSQWFVQNQQEYEQQIPAANELRNVKEVQKKEDPKKTFTEDYFKLEVSQQKSSIEPSEKLDPVDSKIKILKPVKDTDSNLSVNISQIEHKSSDVINNIDKMNRNDDYKDKSIHYEDFNKISMTEKNMNNNQHYFDMINSIQKDANFSENSNLENKILTGIESIEKISIKSTDIDKNIDIEKKINGNKDYYQITRKSEADYLKYPKKISLSHNGPMFPSNLITSLDSYKHESSIQSPETDQNNEVGKKYVENKDFIQMMRNSQIDDYLEDDVLSPSDLMKSLDNKINKSRTYSAESNDETGIRKNISINETEEDLKNNFGAAKLNHDDMLSSASYNTPQYGKTDKLKILFADDNNTVVEGEAKKMSVNSNVLKQKLQIENNKLFPINNTDQKLYDGVKMRSSINVNSNESRLPSNEQIEKNEKKSSSILTSYKNDMPYDLNLKSQQYKKYYEINSTPESKKLIVSPMESSLKNARVSTRSKSEERQSGISSRNNVNIVPTTVRSSFLIGNRSSSPNTPTFYKDLLKFKNNNEINKSKPARDNFNIYLKQQGPNETLSRSFSTTTPVNAKTYEIENASQDNAYKCNCSKKYEIADNDVNVPNNSLKQNRPTLSQIRTFSKNISNYRTPHTYSNNQSNINQYNCSKKYEIDQENAIIQFDISFQSYVNEHNLTIFKSINNASPIQRYANDRIMTIKTIVQPNISKMKVPIDNNNDLLIIVLKRDNNEVPHTNASNTIFANIERGYNSMSKEKYYRLGAEKPSPLSEPGLDRTLSLVYEQQLLPLQSIIQKLKHEIDSLSEQQELFRQTVLGTEKSRYVRVTSYVKKCGCHRKCNS